MRKQPSKPMPSCQDNVCRQVTDHLMVSLLWAAIHANTNLMGLLTFIKSPLFTGATRQKPTESLQEAKEALLTLKQGDTSNGDYLNKFWSLVEHVEHHGSEPGCHHSRVDALVDLWVDDPTAPTEVGMMAC